MSQVVSILPEGIVHDLPEVAQEALVVHSLPSGSYTAYDGTKTVDFKIAGADLKSVTVRAFKRHDGNLRLRFSLSHTDNTTVPATPHQEAEVDYADYTLGGLTGQVCKLAVSSVLVALFSGIDTGDLLGIGIERAGDESADTYEADFDIVAVDFEIGLPTPAQEPRLAPWRKRIRASDLRLRVMLQEQILSQTSVGGQAGVWSDIQNIWADIRPISAYERTQAMQAGTFVSHWIFIRYLGMLSNLGALVDNASRRLRITYGSKTYKIAGVVDHGDILELVCVEEQLQT
jgi:head-tail adaptor